MFRLLSLVSLVFLFSNFVVHDKREMVALKIETAPQIDGIANDEIWQSVEWSENFIQRIPYENVAPTERTRFKVLYDNNNLYFLVQCFDNSPNSIDTRMSRRDGFTGDQVEVQIDSYHDLTTGFSFAVNAAGVKSDASISDDGYNWDPNWDPIWNVKTSLNKDGWLAEMEIPLSQLRFSNNEEHVWGLQVNRYILRKEEHSSWQFISPKANGWVHHFGELKGINNIKPQKQREITAYVSGGYETYQPDHENPFAPGRELFGNTGLDGKIGLTNDFTLDFTINPDFGQVESDPSEVNLTTFETYRQEKRPFFIEGKEILSFRLSSGGPMGRDNLFYSRRIGKQPSYYPELDDDIEYSDRPNNTTILGAFKVTGKSKKGTSIGIMESVTQREYAVIDSLGRRSKTQIEPLTNYFTARVKQDLNDGNTIVGASVTSTNRELSDENLAAFMHKEAYTAGFDFSHQWKDKKYYINLSTSMSNVKGTEEAIYNTQINSPHYLHREDADYIHADSTLKNLSGYSGNFQIGKGSGKIEFMNWITWRSPRFNSNDIGYNLRTDEINQVFWIGYHQNEPKGIFRQYWLNFNQWSGWMSNFDYRYFGGNINTNATFTNFWNMGFGADLEMPGSDPTALRGGPAIRNSGGRSAWVFLESDSRKKVVMYANTSFWWDKTSVNRYRRVEIGANIQAADALQIRISPEYVNSDDGVAYVANIDDWDEMRYVRGKLKRNEFNVTLRANYNITPDFTIQLYAMPFISAGKYSEFKYISDPRAKEFDNRYIVYENQPSEEEKDNDVIFVDENSNGEIDYQFDNPNYNSYDFNSNLVIRWEYLPGSTLFLVWNINFNDHQSTGDFNFSRDYKELFDSYPHNVFLVKLSYRLGV